MHLRIEVGKWWLQVGKDDGTKGDQPAEPPYIDHHPPPQVLYHPERVGFYRMTDETD